MRHPGQMRLLILALTLLLTACGGKTDDDHQARCMSFDPVWPGGVGFEGVVASDKLDELDEHVQQAVAEGQVTFVNYALGQAFYDGQRLSVTSEDTSPTGLAFKPDGTKMYVLGSGSDAVYQYTLSTPWDLSTASYDSVSFSVTEDGSPEAIAFSPAGSRLYVLGSDTDTVYQYYSSVLCGTG